MKEKIDEEAKAKIIDACLSKNEISELVESGEVEIGKYWINNFYGYRQQLFAEAIKKLRPYIISAVIEEIKGIENPYPMTIRWNDPRYMHRLSYVLFEDTRQAIIARLEAP